MRLPGRAAMARTIMRLKIHTLLDYEIDAEADILLQIEAASGCKARII